MTSRGRSSFRWVAEFVLIVGSVYLGVYLEGASQRQADRAAARTALGQLRGEVQEDLRDLDRIVGVQESLSGDYENLGRWLTDARPMPPDSVGAALLHLAMDNPTLFPRRATWTTMVAGDQLSELGSPALALRLGHLYETIYPRIDYNGRLYDENILAVMRTAPVQWQSLNSAPLSGDDEAKQRLASSLTWCHVTWNLFHRDLLGGFRADLLTTIDAVDAYLAGEAEPAETP